MADILLVEDDEQVRMLIEEFLAGAGHRVFAAETLAAGCSMLENGHSYDLVVTDGRLPDGNGLTIAADATAKGIKVIIISGYPQEFLAEQLARYTFLGKPFRMAELLTVITEQLSPP